MKKITTLIFICTLSLTFAQEKYFVTAPNGLSCRLHPDLDAIKIGKLPYGSIIELVKTVPGKLSVTDNGEIIEGQWKLVQFSNFPYMISKNGNTEYNQEAYVFDGYLVPLNKATIEIEDLAAAKFKDYNSKSIQNRSEQEKVSDFASAKKLLKDKVTWLLLDNTDDHYYLDSIRLDNGQILKSNDQYYEYDFIAYYPKEEVLLFEGGHSSDFSISLKTGETTETSGNPEYIKTSPNNKIRLNGYFPGQECSDYFFQEIKDDRLIYLTNFGWGSVNGDDVCNFKDFIWINDHQFVYSHLDYSTNSETGVLKYRKGTITKTFSK